MKTFLIYFMCFSMFALKAYSEDTQTLPEYRKSAIEELKKLNNDKNWLKEQLDKLPKSSGKWGDETWISDRFIIMKNGEWLIYTQKCSKKDRQANKLLKGEELYDIFIAIGNDGKWYYSTYHFCIDMLELRQLGQPKSLKEFLFEQDFRCKEFDGQPDNCTKSTEEKSTGNKGLTLLN